jgi:acyl homoserine lactone synthase
MITIVSAANKHLFDLELEDAFKLRHKIFKEKLNWDVSTFGAFEIDQFDFSDATYLLYIEETVKGVWRILPTTGRYMLKNAFPQMLDGEDPPVDSGIWEVSRLAVQENLNLDNGLASVGRITAEMLCGLTEFAMANGVHEILSVQDVRITRLQARLGCRPYRLSSQQMIGNVLCELGRFRINPQVLTGLRHHSGISGTVLNPQFTHLVEAA